MKFVTTAASRDPVCEAIESLLRDLETQGGGSLQETTRGDFVRLSFGEIGVRGETRDIALVRLASALMDDQRYFEILMEALRAPMLAGK